MIIKITSRPKNINLVGNPGILQECEEQLENDPMNYTPEMINFSDLVFTLKNNPGKYLRPFVVYRDGKLYVVSNKTFHKAARQAGLTRIKFDLSIDRLPPLEMLMRDFDLECFSPPIKNEVTERFLFFKQQPGYFEYEHELVIPNPRNLSPEFQEHNCLAYKIMIETPRKTHEIENELVPTLVNQNSYLRSIDGITTRDWSLGKYIR